MCFFMASTVKKWTNFAKWAIKWIIWQPWYVLFHTHYHMTY